MKISEIIGEANILVPNEVDNVDKVIWLNSLQHDFFNVVKIPKLVTFLPIKGQSQYSVGSDVREKNIDLVMVGVIKYHKLIPETTNPLQNTYFFTESDKKLNLYPSPYQDGLTGFLRYNQISTTVFVSTDLTKIPDIPEEYQWTLIPGLASFIANTQDDAIKASNYEQQYKATWNVAAQNYAGAVT